VVTALVAIGVACTLPAGAASDTQPVADLAVALIGPTDGAVGDILSYTVTVTNNGPDAFDLATAADLLIGYETDGGLKYLDNDARCGVFSAGPNRENADCGFTAPLGVGQTFVVHARYQVLQRLWLGIASRHNPVARDGFPWPTTTASRCRCCRRPR